MNRAIAALHGQFGRACLYSQSRSMATHAHREGHLIFYLEGCNPRFDVAGRGYVGATDRAIAVNPFEPHDVTYRDGDPPCLLLLLYIEPDWFAARGADAELRFGRACIDVTPTVRKLVERTVELLVGQGGHRGDGRRGGDRGNARSARRRGGEGDGEGRTDACLHALTRACHERSRRTDVHPDAYRLEGGVRDHRVRKSVGLLQRSVGGELSLDAVAREVGLSRPHFFKLFRENVGVTPNVYLNTVRTERAIERLVGTEQAVTSIALDLGFSSQASFTRFFSANVGIPPTDYRRVAHTA